MNVGTIVVSTLVKVLCERLSSPLLKEFSLLWGVEKDLRTLESTISTVKDVLEDTEECSITDKQVYNWLKKLKQIVYDADDLLDELYLEAQRQKGDSVGQASKVINNILSISNPVKRIKLAQKIKSINKMLDAVAVERAKFHLKGKTIKYSENNIINYRETWSKIDEGAICGRDHEKKEIINWLMQKDASSLENMSVIAIVGLGGLGKTTLAQLVYNNEEVKGYFDLKMWVYVSQIINFRKIVRELIESATRTKCDIENFDTLGEILRSELKGKKFLIVLDDVWSENYGEYWGMLKNIFSFGAFGSKIIVTTRSLGVSKIMKATSLLKLEGLSEEISWELFKQKAFCGSEMGVNSQIVEIAKEIMKKCAGVPLALKALGCIMQSENSIEKWLDVRDSEIWELSNGGDHVIKSLKLSYMYLRPPLKECFTYCSIFPKGQVINKLQLIGQWIAHGFISLPGDKGSIEDKGNEYFEQLGQMSFLQNIVEESNGEVTCKMHDLVHDLARSIVAHEFSVINEMDVAANVSIGCRYLYLSKCSGMIETSIARKVRALHIEVANIADAEIISKAKSLRSLVLVGVHLERFTFWSQKIIHLRYVCFMGCNFTEIPIDFGALWSLQSLHLKRCHYIRKLPELIGQVVSLRTLELDCEKLESLPESIGECQSLQNLVVRSKQLRNIPTSIGQLINIRFLDFFECHELRNLPNNALSKLISIKSINLGYCLDVEEIPISIGNLVSLKSLYLSGCKSLKSLPDSIGGLQNLNVLHLNLTEIKVLPSSISKLVNLDSLNVSGCYKLRELPEGIGEMKNLRVLEIDRCPLVGMPVGIGKLTKLQKLSKFVVGEGKKYAHISELKNLDFLSGYLKIYGLCNVTNPKEAFEANLKQKKDIKHMKLQWGKLTSERDVNVDVDLAVLEALQPPPGINGLELNGYPGAEYSKWMMLAIEEMNMSSFPDLTFLFLASLKKCTHLPRLIELPSLRHLWLSEMDSLKSFTDDHHPRPPPLTSVVDSSQSEMITNKELLAGADFSNEAGRTESLPDHECPLLEEISSLESLSIPIIKQHLSSLLEKRISRCECLYVLGNLKSLERRSLCDTSQTSLPRRMQRLSSLQSLVIQKCPQLEKRCERESGEEWYLISHIPNVFIW